MQNTRTNVLANATIANALFGYSGYAESVLPRGAPVDPPPPRPAQVLAPEEEPQA